MTLSAGQRFGLTLQQVLDPEAVGPAVLLEERAVAVASGQDRERVFYDGSRADGIIDRIEYQNESMGKTFYIRARGTF